MSLPTLRRWRVRVCAACVHRHLAAAAGERELPSRLRVEADDEALVDVDALFAREP